MLRSLLKKQRHGYNLEELELPKYGFFLMTVLLMKHRSMLLKKWYFGLNELI
jgi:hypothetical protein